MFSKIMLVSAAIGNIPTIPVRDKSEDKKSTVEIKPKSSSKASMRRFRKEVGRTNRLVQKRTEHLENQCSSLIKQEKAADLIKEADLLMRSGFREEAIELYRLAGLECLKLADQEISFGQINPYLVAGLCFEMHPEMSEEAERAFKLALEISFKQLQMLEEVDTDGIHDLFMKWMFSAPMVREACLSSLHLGNKEQFAELMESQVREGSYLYSLLEETEGDSERIASTIASWIAVSEVILGPDHPSVLAMSQMKIPSAKRDLEIEAALLEIFAIPKDFSEGLPVGELIKRLEEDILPRP